MEYTEKDTSLIRDDSAQQDVDADTPPASACPADTKHPVDLLYVVGTGSVADNWELRYSLRSVERFVKPESIGRVIVVGAPPTFLSDKVERLTVPNIPGMRKHWNILNCISVAVKEFGIDRPFLYSSDDHFLTSAVDFHKYPVFCRFNFKSGFVFGEKEFHEWAKRTNRNVIKATKYQKCLMATRALLDTEGLPAFWTSWHGNTWMFPDCIEEAVSLYDKYKDKIPTTLGYEPTIMINAIRVKKIVDSCGSVDFMRLPRDVKANKLATIQHIAVKEGWFSVGDEAWLDSSFKAFMFGLYMRPCRYEK